MTTDGKMRGRDWTWAGIIGVVLLVMGASYFLHRADDTKPADWVGDELTYLPSGKFLKPMVLDQDATVGDILWTKGMIYFATAYLEKKSYRWLAHILDIVTTLNPRFYKAYEFGGVVLTKEKSEIPKTLKLLDRGIAEFPHDWQLRVYAAMAQLALDSNFNLAAEYLKPVTLEKDVPDHIRTITATFLEKGGGRRVALAFLIHAYVRSDNSINREIFVKKILKMYGKDSMFEATARSRILESMLDEASQFPQAEILVLGVMNEYMTDNMSKQTQGLVDALIKPATPSMNKGPSH
jgi:hypothetical protein